MRLRLLPVAASTLFGLLFAGCDQPADDVAANPTKESPVEHADPFAVTEDEITADEPIPKTLDEALDLMMEGLTDEERKIVEDAGEEYSTMAHFGGGMGMRNSWGLWGDSPLSRYFARLGIYHADDMSAIINKAFSRRVRGKDIELEALVEYYRGYWAKTDTIAPLDLSCPTCGEEMNTGYMGSGVSRKHPERKYFFGMCRDDEREFLFYHKVGWKTSESVKSEQSEGSTARSRESPLASSL